MTSPRRGRSSSVLLSSSPRTPSVDWPASSPTASQTHSQPSSPIRQRSARRMSPARSSAGADVGRQSSQKRASSLAGFFSKILPSNRPEQGGTRRTNDWTADTDMDSATNINELTSWNLAKEKNPAYNTSRLVPGESSHRRVWSWSLQKGDSKFVENLPRDRSRGREPETDPPGLEELPPRNSQSLTRAEVHELVKSKEEARRNRRSLKESGDWLGVQGADPYSGQYSVLTPTDTVSSETTNTSTRSKLAELARKRKTARLEYEQLRLLEEQEKDKAKLDREQAKLDKIERVKEELRRQQQFAKWSQHKRQWSSAAEPSLSPIAQSLDSVALGSSETSSLLFSGMSTDSLSSDVEDPTSAVPNFSRPTRLPVSAKNTSPGQAERFGSESTRPFGHTRLDVSTDTIIHNSPDGNSKSASLTRNATQPIGAHPIAGQGGMGRTKSERHFLWRRRRVTDPGKSNAVPPGARVMSMVAQNQTLNSIEHIQKDHFSDLMIPDYHLHLLSSPEPVETADSQSTVSEDSPPTTPNPSFLGLGAVGENRMALSSTTNLVYFQGNDKSSQEKNLTTATSSQSKLKGIMKRPSIRRRLVPNLLATTHAVKDTRRHQTPPPPFDDLQDHAVSCLPGNTPEYRNQLPQSDLQGRISVERAARTPTHTDSHIKPLRRESVSIPTTIITGCAPNQENRSGSLRSRRGYEPSQTDGTTEPINAPATPASFTQDERRITVDPRPQQHRTPSPPTTIQNGSPNTELPQETPETATISTRPVETEKKPPTRVSTPTTPRLCRLIQQNLETREAEKPKNMDMVKRTGATKTQMPERTKARGINPREGQAWKVDQGRHSTSIVRTPAMASQEAHQPPSSGEQKEDMVEEVARVAVLRSKAKEIVRSRSKSTDRKAGRNRSRTPSPVKKQAPHGKAVEPKHPLQQRHPKKKHHSEDGAGIGLPSRPEHVSGGIPQVQHKKGVPEGIDTSNTHIAVMHFCKMVYTLSLGLACTWWIAVRPAFDQQSEIWRRKYRNESTWKDAAIFVSAGIFCFACMLGSWYALKMLCWCL
ncbi:hypothetical protein GGS26DRAFT_468198 [Hypomontagnella submonticulosa]|nr:hypothetical protein GGS26DRAFT_468198 [Hypomontagnella submonticulosa]